MDGEGEGWKDGHGVGEWLAKGLTVCWWQVFVHGPETEWTVSRRMWNVRTGLLSLRRWK